ncbi:NAD-binding protein [Nocardioides sp. YIM 123512]|uniref:NAD-binding protein n=2 Tax=Nocardioides flavescens TaxID=2691959 RepID=A0A6L7F1N3_9ACTN|nr:NAD-binding protein [Nocardioides flavescens]
MTTVAVLGTGKIGAAMARQLMAHEHDVRVWNRSEDKAKPLADDGAVVAADPAEAARGADVVLVVLFDADSVVEVLEQAAAGFGEETVVVQSSTVGLDISRVAEVADRLGVGLLDAPVLGTRGPAEQGKLTVLASGDPSLRRVADPVFKAVGARTVWVGDEVGAASRLKLVCNAWVGSITAAIGQSVALAEGLGLDPQLFVDAVSGSAVDAPYVAIKAGWMTSDDDSVAFDVDGVRKDLGLITAAAEGHGVDTRLLQAVKGAYDEAAEAGHGSEDMAAVRSAF